MLSYHDFSISKALLDLFPNIGLDSAKFTSPCTCTIFLFIYLLSIYCLIDYLWRHEENRREFFVKYAEQNGFDPLVAENWYNQSSKSILSVKVSYIAIYKVLYSCMNNFNYF